MKAIRLLSIFGVIVTATLGSHAQGPLTNGLVAYYPFSGDAQDASGNGNNGAVTNATLAADRFGAVNSAYSFNGQNAQIIVNDSAALGSLTSNYTFNVWARFASVPSIDSCLLIKSAGAGHQQKWTFWQHVEAPPLGIGVLLFRPADGQYQWNDNHPFATNRWYMLTFSASGTNCAIAVDGVVVSVQPGNMTLPETAGLAMSIGGAEPGGNQWFNGSLDDIRIYNRTLSASEIQQLHIAESAPPTPPVSNDGVIYVANQGSSTIRAFALTNGADLGVFASNGIPAAHGIALDTAGNVYVASLIDNVIRRFSPSGLDLGIFVSNGVASPRSLVFDTNGNLYVANYDTSSVHCYSPTGADLGPFITNGLANPTGMAFDAAGNLYVANYDLNDVKKFAPNGAPLGTAISTGLNQPVGIVVLPNDGGFYVANDFASSIVRYDANGTIVSNLTSGTLGRLFYLASDAEGNLYVTRVEGNAIRKFSPTGQDLGDIATTGMDIPAGIAIRQSAVANPPNIVTQPSSQQRTAGENVVFSVVAEGTPPLSYQWRFNGTNLVNGGPISGAISSQLVISNVQSSDAGSYSVVVSNSVNAVTSSNATLSVTTPPISNDGVIYVANQGSSNVRTFALTNGADLGVFASNGIAAAHGIALDAAGNVYVASVVDNTIRRFSPTGLDLGIFASNGVASPRSLVFDTNGNLYVANYDTSSVHRYSPAGADLGPFITNGLANPTGMAFDAAGNLYVANYDLNDVKKFAPNGAPLGTAISTGLNQPVGIVVLPNDGGFYVANDFASSIIRYDGSGTIVSNLTSGTLGRLFYLASDADGNLYVTRVEGNAIRKFSPTGQDLGDIATTGMDIPAGIVIRQSAPASPTPPVILGQPSNQQRTVGANASFVVAADGTHPLFYQWRLNGTNLVDGGRISGATSAQLVISNVQLSDAGAYSVVVSNSVNSVPSSNATLTVIAPPAVVSVVNTTNAAGGLVTVPIRLIANGNENALGFSLNIGTQPLPAVLTFDSVVLGSNAVGASLLVNTNQLGSRRIGVAIALPAGNTFAAGTQEVVQVRFQSGVLVGSNNRVISLTFGDQPTVRQLVSTNATVLPATYANGAVTLMPSDIEGDSVPRPSGDRVAGITDWVQIGRFVALLDTPAVGGEFQRADCAPKEVLGDGQIKVTDWVQAGRYAAGLDPLRAVGGPTSPSLFLLRNNEVEGASSGRDLRTLGGSVYPGQTISVPVVLESQGDENALSFSVAFNPAVFSYAGLTPGSDGMTLSTNVNISQIASGKLGVVVGLAANNTFAAGPRELLKVNLEVLPTVVPGDYPIGLGDQPVLRGISNPGAGELTSTYSTGALSVALPALQIARSGPNIRLSWPVAAWDFTLQTSSDGSLPGVVWTNVPGVLLTNGGDISITLPLGEHAGFYRLQKP